MNRNGTLELHTVQPMKPRVARREIPPTPPLRLSTRDASSDAGRAWSLLHARQIAGVADLAGRCSRCGSYHAVRRGSARGNASQSGHSFFRAAESLARAAVGRDTGRSGRRNAAGWYPVVPPRAPGPLRGTLHAERRPAVVTPDDKMTVPIDRLLFWAARCAQRVVRLCALPAEQLETPEFQAVARREDEFVRAYRTVLRLRAAEVAAFCHRVGLRGCTAALVRDNPFLIVLAIDKHLQGGGA